jgi:hypothetical protein
MIKFLVGTFKWLFVYPYLFLVSLGLAYLGMMIIIFILAILFA